METIFELTADRVDWLHQGYRLRGWGRPEGYFQAGSRAQERGEMVVLVRGRRRNCWDSQSHLGPRLRAFSGTRHPGDQRPERRPRPPSPGRRYPADGPRGDHCTRSHVAGIGVGLHPGYAAAQRMYVLRGYVPDGNPLTYRNEFVQQGQHVVLDDDLTLQSTKSGSFGMSPRGLRHFRAEGTAISHERKRQNDRQYTG